MDAESLNYHLHQTLAEHRAWLKREWANGNKPPFVIPKQPKRARWHQLTETQKIQRIKGQP